MENTSYYRGSTLQGINFHLSMVHFGPIRNKTVNGFAKSMDDETVNIIDDSKSKAFELGCPRDHVSTNGCFEKRKF